MTVETDTIKNSKESPSKTKRKRASRSSSSGSSSSGSTSSSSASSRSSSSSSSNSSSSSSRSSSAASSPEKKNDRPKVANNNKSSNKRPTEHGTNDDKQNLVSSNQTRRSPSPLSRRQEKEKEATKIYIGKLSLNVNKDHLSEIFGTFGEIKEIELLPHRIHPHLHRTYAHIEYVSSGGAEQACKYMDGGQVDGKEIVCVPVHGQPPHLTSDRNRREVSPYRRRRRSPLPPRHYPPPRRMGDRDRDRGRYNDRRGGYSPPSRNYRRGQSPPPSSRRTGASGNTVESPKKKERRYSRSSSSESK